MKSIALHSLKGGSGKTSTAIHVAAALTTPRQRAVLLDADPQRSAIQWSEWSIERGRPFPFDVRPLDASTDYLIRSRIEVLGRRFDYVVIDLPPEIAQAAEAVAGNVDLMLVPCTPSALDLHSAFAAIELGRRARDRRGDGRPLISCVPTMVAARTRAGAELPGALREYGEPVSIAIRRSVAVAQATIDGGLVRPSTPVGKDFQHLAEHVKRRLRKELK